MITAMIVGLILFLFQKKKSEETKTEQLFSKPCGFIANLPVR